MKLTDVEILKLLNEPRNEDAIARGASLQKQHKIHITGDGTGYLSIIKKVEGYESNEDYLNVKKQIAKPSTILITSTIIDNLNRWTSAQGTVKKVDFKDPEKNKNFELVLDKVWNNNSFDNFINSFYKEAIYQQFNGFMVVTKPKVNIEEGVQIKEGVIKQYDPAKALDPYLIFISISDIKDYYLTGDKVEYLIIKLDKENKKYRVIDDAFDRVVNYGDGEFTNESEPIPNKLGYVPARKITNIDESLLDCQVKTSPINHIIPALDRYLSCDCDARMQMIKHNYPKLAIVTRECLQCSGSGKILDTQTYNDAIEHFIICNTCNGSGKEIPISRDGVIGLPSSLLDGDTPYPGAPATYITPDIESLKLALEDLEKQRKDILYAGTGDKTLIQENLQTATENMINSRSLEDRIAEISRMTEEFETFLKKAIKEMHEDFAVISDYSIVVKYGKKISLKGEAEILSEIKQSKENGMNRTFIQSLYLDLIYIKNKNNENELKRQILLNDIEPFAGYTVDEILKFKEFISDRDLKLKINFEALIDRFESEQDTPVEFLYSSETYKKDIQVIKEKLYTYVDEIETKEEPKIEPELISVPTE